MADSMAFSLVRIDEEPAGTWSVDATFSNGSTYFTNGLPDREAALSHGSALVAEFNMQMGRHGGGSLWWERVR